MRRGFTLIEIMVVVSILAMLSSVIIAGIAPARAQARDSLRIQQVRQIDLAVQLYKARYGHAPDIGGSCAAQMAVMTADRVPGCVAISTSAVAANQTAWQTLKTDLAPFMPSIPSDPCGTGCSVTFGNDLGYTYYSPAAVQFNTCNPPSSCGQSVAQLNDKYQLSAQLERQNTQAGVPASLPTITANIVPAPGPDGPTVLSWSSTNSTSCIFLVDGDKSGAWDYYAGWIGPIPTSGNYTFPDTVLATFIFSCTGSGGTATKNYVFSGF